MSREQMINFLQTAVVFLLLTNAASIIAAVYAIRIAKAFAPGGDGPRILRRGHARRRREP